VSEVPQPVAASAWLETARLALATGKPVDAATAAQQALAIAAKAEVAPRDLAEMRLALASALLRSHRDAARARSLAHEAAAAFTRLRAPDRAAAALAVADAP
jgi:hypothetical protein